LLNRYMGILNVVMPGSIRHPGKGYMLEMDLKAIPG